MMATTAAPCIFFPQGRCRNGDACRFSHDSPPPVNPHPRPDPRAQVLCKFYLQGICKHGAKCPYRHEASDSPIAVEASHEPASEVVRVFRGALIRFGDGACVTSLSLSSEYSSVRLDGLAANTTSADVIAILEALGHDVEVDGLRIVPTPQSSPPLCSAYISTPDLEFPTALCDSLLLSSTYENLTAKPVPPRLPTWASTRRARCNRLQLRWPSPRKEVCLYFLAHQAALRVSGKFNSGKYMVRNTRIHCDEPELEHGALWMVQALGLPGCSSEEMVRASITADYDHPILIAGLRQSAKKIWTLASVKDFLGGFGTISFMSEPYEHAGAFLTATAHFNDDCAAQEAARSIEKSSDDLPYHDRLTARIVYNSTFKVSNEVYHHIQKHLQDCLEELKAPRMSTIPRENGTVLSLDSWSSEDSAKYANAVEDIVAGSVIEGKDGKPFWAPQLASNGPASKALREIQQEHEVLLLPNRSKRELRYFGDLTKQKAVQGHVVQSLTEDAEQRYTIELDDAGFSWLCTTGLNLLKIAVGDNVVSLHVTSKPKKLIITGTEEEQCEVMAILQIHDISFPVKEVTSTVEQNCTICFTPADDPVVLGCGHTYCADCFTALCRNGSAQTDVRVACSGAEDICKNAIPLREIQAHVDPSTFEQLLESSFNTYISRRLEQFRYCPTPDCGYLYRPASSTTSAKTSHMCPKCLKRICRSCHANHDGQRCDEYQASATFEAYKHEHRSNVKDCPKCQTTIEKTDGCNHMECGGCHIHICWECMETFEQPDHCYDHMRAVHRGIGVGDDWDNEEEDEEEDEEEEAVVEEDDGEEFVLDLRRMADELTRARDILDNFRRIV
ncbi:hypothetical protein F5B22DRAFT_293623 [Xylaria bambusicola]|uniref:uncharacterized protein n=1 Tax=Xylaria bambusicola TaxID=326684 RepID=UPI002007EF7D|nr:uncharacterized protein F5B22DRAFT_293623 [Xylaria bambusicola]KAI0512792.1 hypothetical protein F5B22DRAFT_293623 [Xylaria bambusicola]